MRSGIIATPINHCRLTRLLATSLSRRTGQSFATVGFLVNIESDRHRDSHNASDSKNVVWNVGQSSGSLNIGDHELPRGSASLHGNFISLECGKEIKF